MNLTDANIKGLGVSPDWTQLYQAKQEYGLADLTPTSMDGLFQRMLTDDALFQLYFKYENLSSLLLSLYMYVMGKFDYQELLQERR